MAIESKHRRKRLLKTADRDKKVEYLLAYRKIR